MYINKKAVQFLYWVITGIFVFLFIFLLVKLFPFYGAVFSFLWYLLAPFLIACLIAYLLHPIVCKLHELGMPKSIAILLIYLIFFGGGTYLVYQFYPTFLLQLRDLNEHLPDLVNMYETIIYQVYESTSLLPETVHEKIDQVITKVETDIEQFIGKIIGAITKIFDIIIWITVIPVLVFYFLKDYDHIKEYMKRFIPNQYLPEGSKLVHAVNESLGGYIRGQLIVSFFVGLVTYAVFQILELKYALLLGIIMGLTNIIPYFGPIIGAIPVIAIAITVSGKMVIYALIAIFAIQLIEGNFLAPYIVGKTTELHPVVIIFILLLGGQLGGVIGMILAVPFVTIMKVIIKHVSIMRSY